MDYVSLKVSKFQCFYVADKMQKRKVSGLIVSNSRPLAQRKLNL